MTARRNRPAEELWQLLLSLAEDLDRLPDEVFLAEVREGGVDPHEVAGRTRQVLRDAEISIRRGRLAQARGAVAAFGSKLAASAKDWMPSSVAERRSLLASMLAGQPDLRPALTVQFRDFRDLTDEDVESILVQLHELGVDHEGR